MKPTLYLFVGYPGAGKTTVAKLVADVTGGVHLWADQERHKRFGTPTHSAEESNALYDALNNETKVLLTSGLCVVFDTNFNFRSDRDKLRAIADECGANSQLIWVTTPENLAKDRATNTEVPPRNGYDQHMSLQQFDSITSKLEAPTDDEQPLIVDGTNIDRPLLLQQLGLN